MKKILIITILGLCVKLVCWAQTSYINHGFTYLQPYNYLPSLIVRLSPINSIFSDTCTIKGEFFYSDFSSTPFFINYNLKENKFTSDSAYAIIDSIGFRVRPHRTPSLYLNGTYYTGMGLINQTNGVSFCVLYKYDANFNSKFLGNVLPTNNNNVGLISFINSNNNIVFVGQDYAFQGSGPSFMGRVFIAELDTLGNILSVKYSTSQVGSNFIPCDYAQTDNGIIVIGHRVSHKYHNVISDYASTGVAVLFRNNGTQKILKIGSEKVDTDLPLLSIAKLNHSEFLIRTWRMDTLEVGAPIKDAIMCMDTALNVKWIQNLDSTHQISKRPGAILRTKDKNFVINGSEINLEVSEQYQDAFRQPFLRKIDSNGKYIWKRTIIYNEKFFHQTLGEIIEMPNEDLLMYGSLMDIKGLVETPLQKMWVVRTDKYGCLVPGCELWDDIDEKEADAAKISYYPNPFQHELYIFNPAHHLFYKGQIIDLSGKVVKNDIQLAPQTTTIVPLAHLSRGVYILKLVNDAGEMQTYKIIKN